MKENSYSIKASNKEEWLEIAKIYMEAFSKPPYNEPWTLNKAISKIKIFSKYCEIYKIINDKEKIIGFIIINPNHWFPGKFCFIEDFVIKKEFRNKQIGSEIIKEIEKIYLNKGFEYLVGLANKESRAFNFWKKLGLKENRSDKFISRRLK